MKSFFLNLTTCVLLCSTQATLAATTYRCGNSFQDTPCANQSDHKTGKPTKSASASKSETTNATSVGTKSADLSPYQIDADCKQRGDAAKKMMWLREIGKTKEDQLSNAPDEPTQALIHEVYSNRGSSLDVKNKIEQAGMQQKEQDKLAEQLLSAARKLKQRDGLTSTKVTEQSSDSHQ